jgi:hypothetical protein
MGIGAPWLTERGVQLPLKRGELGLRRAERAWQRQHMDKRATSQARQAHLTT